MTLVSTGEITISDINDVAALILSSSSHVLPASSDGVVPSSAFVGVTVTATVREGSGVGTDWTLSAPVSSQADSSTDDLTFDWSHTPGTGVGTLTLTGMQSDVDAATVDFTASKIGASTVTARYSVAKAKAGAPAGIYQIRPSVAVIKVSGNYSTASLGNITFTPSSITFSATKITAGLGLTPIAPVSYSDGYIRLQTSTDGSTWTTVGSDVQAASSSYTITDADIKYLRGLVSATSDFSDILDAATVPVVADGSEFLDVIGDAGSGLSGGTGVTVSGYTSLTVGPAGSAEAPPDNPATYITIKINGVPYKIPVYKAS